MRRWQLIERFNLGPGGTCECLKCGHTMAHNINTPCAEIDCPKCGAKMTRKK